MGDALLATITIDVDPTFDIGPMTLAWHGLATAVSLLAGSAVDRASCCGPSSASRARGAW